MVVGHRQATSLQEQQQRLGFALDLPSCFPPGLPLGFPFGLPLGFTLVVGPACASLKNFSIWGSISNAFRAASLRACSIRREYSSRCSSGSRKTAWTAARPIGTAVSTCEPGHALDVRVKICAAVTQWRL